MKKPFLWLEVIILGLVGVTLGVFLILASTGLVRASEPVTCDSDGYIKGDAYAPVRTPNSTSSKTTGYISTQSGHDSAQDGYVRIKSRTVGKRTVTTGIIGNRTVRVITETEDG